MCLLITVIAALISTILWRRKIKNDKYKLSTLAIIYWGASLMWVIDLINELLHEGLNYFHQPLNEVLSESLLGAAVVALGIVIWLIVLAAKGTFKKKN